MNCWKGRTTVISAASGLGTTVIVSVIFPIDNGNEAWSAGIYSDCETTDLTKNIGAYFNSNSEAFLNAIVH